MNNIPEPTTLLQLNNTYKLDFKNKRSTNNVPISRMKVSKNENISPSTMIHSNKFEQNTSKHPHV
jgi:hypothetical protein